MTIGLDSVVGIRVSLNASESDVRTALAQLVETGLVRAGEADDNFVLTHAGQQVATTGGISSPHGGGRGGRRGGFIRTETFFQMRMSSGAAEPGWRELGGMVAGAWGATQAAKPAKTQQSDGEMLVGDVEREAALSGLSGAYGDGRLDQAELDRRTDLVLHARTRGDLDAAFEDIPKTAAKSGPGSARGTTFTAVALLSIPLAALGLLMFIGDDPGTKLLGAGLLVALGLGLLRLAFWAFPHGPTRPRRHWHH